MRVHVCQSYRGNINMQFEVSKGENGCSNIETYGDHCLQDGSEVVDVVEADNPPSACPWSKGGLHLPGRGCGQAPGELQAKLQAWRECEGWTLSLLDQRKRRGPRGPRFSVRHSEGFKCSKEVGVADLCSAETLPHCHANIHIQAVHTYAKICANI